MRECWRGGQALDVGGRRVRRMPYVNSSSGAALTASSALHQQDDESRTVGKQQRECFQPDWTNRFLMQAQTFDLLKPD